jgi:rhodanese-related sulfurtransferase
MKIYNFSTYVVILIVSLLPMGKALAADNIPLMTKDELKAILDAEDVTILDVRLGKDWKSSEFKIKGAIRTDPKQIGKWSENLKKENRLVLYCA